MEIFQFLYGAIGSVRQVLAGNFETRFQFLYGAIGSFTEQRDRIKKISFNSYMVRLEESTRHLRITRPAFSIPIWCDWKRLWQVSLIVDLLFQFLYGAIGSFRT